MRILPIASLLLLAGPVLLGAEGDATAPAPIPVSEPAPAPAAPTKEELVARIKQADEQLSSILKRVEAESDIVALRKTADEAKKTYEQALKDDATYVAAKAEADAAKAVVEAKTLELLLADAEVGPAMSELVAAKKAEVDATAALQAAKEAGDKDAENKAEPLARAAKDNAKAVHDRVRPLRKEATRRLEKSGNAEYDALRASAGQKGSIAEELTKTGALGALREASSAAWKAFEDARKAKLDAIPEYQAAVEAKAAAKAAVKAAQEAQSKL